jgi:hypothetical protein
MQSFTDLVFRLFNFVIGLKYRTNLNCVQVFTLYCAVSVPHVGYKDQSVNVLRGIKHIGEKGVILHINFS